MITGAATTQPNAKGWYKTDVTVNFTATDEESGIDTITPDTVINTDGTDQSVTGTATDMAGNTASVNWTRCLSSMALNAGSRVRVPAIMSITIRNFLIHSQYQELGPSRRFM